MILWKNYSAMKRDLQHWVSIWSYGVLALMFFFLPEFTQVFLRLLFFLIVKDISVYAIDLSWWIKIKQTDIAKINTLYTQKKVTTAYFLSLINRIYFFPCILTIYLVYLLIQQTQLRDLHQTNRYLITNETVLLTILSGVFLVYKQEEDQKYETFVESRTSKLLYYALSIFLGGLTLFIISWQVSSLWTIGSVISLISWVLVFLVGVLLMEDDEEETRV